MDWILALKTRENETLARLYQNYKSEAVLWVQKEINCSPDDALDLFQTAVVILYDNVQTGKLTTLTSDIKTYLFGVLKNKAKEWTRDQQKQNKLSQSEIWVSYVMEDNDSAVEEDLLKVASTSLIELGDPCRSILQYYYYDDKSMEEITTMMGYKNADTTKNQKYKCLKRLQNIFSNHLQKTTDFEK